MNETDLNLQEEQTFKLKDNSQRAKTLIIVFAILTGLTLIGLLTGYNIV
ncbi:hypothetical protein [Sinomicrobium sp.]